MDTQTNKPQAGAWANMSNEQFERKEKIAFEVDKPIEVLFTNEPTEYQSLDKTGVFYNFPVKSLGEEKIIQTSAWTLLRALKAFVPLVGKKLIITKRFVKGKHLFEVVEKKA